jgi:hypothetical protein
LQANVHWFIEQLTVALAFEGHACAVCHCPVGPQVWMFAPEHRVAPGVHTPKQPPFEQTYGHVTVVCQLPESSQL